MEKSRKIAYAKVISGMIILGSMGVFVRRINLPSAEIALVRAFLGSAFLMLAILLGRQRINWPVLKKQLPLLIVCGASLALNMVFLYEAYRYTSISNATMTYYCGPLIAMLFSPLVLKERLTTAKLLGIAAAMGGLFLINANNIGALGSNPLRGLVFGFLAALMYTAILLVNKFVKDIPGLLNTCMLLLVAWIVLLPYVLFTHSGPWRLPGVADGLISLILLGLIHGGLACYLYYSALQKLPAQSMALCGYFDPVSALFFSALLLSERMTALQWLGALLIFAGAIFGELYAYGQKGRKKAASAAGR